MFLYCFSLYTCLEIVDLVIYLEAQLCQRAREVYVMRSANEDHATRASAHNTSAHNTL